MKKIVSLLFTLAGLSGFAQKQTFNTPEMPVDPETKLISYSSVIDVPGTPKNELYRRGLAWFNSYYKNPTEVIRDKDTVAFKIVGKPRFRITNEPDNKGLKTDGGVVQYTITVACKDNRAKCTLTELNWKQASYYPIEKWVEQKDRYKVNNYYLWQTDSMMKKEVLPEVVKALKTAPKRSTKDDW